MLEGFWPENLVEGAISKGQRWLPSKFVGKADRGGRLAPFGSDGKCVFTYDIHGVECAREVRAAWRALFLPDSKGVAVDARQ